MHEYNHRGDNAEWGVDFPQHLPDCFYDAAIRITALCAKQSQRPDNH
jgi:hypothetical protein